MKSRMATQIKQWLIEFMMKLEIALYFGAVIIKTSKKAPILDQII